MPDEHYKVLAIECRPQTFEEVVGQPHVTRTLQNAINLERIAHAYLFTGARGVGKTSIARILAKALNCEKDPIPTPIPCNQCSNCREITRGNSPDVLEIDGASNRGIDNIRELRETVRYRPAKGRYKVYIVDEVHMLTTEAFNALLKTLEEPPPHVVFIFATTEPHKIPATILSRCQRFDFRRVSLSAIVEHLKKITHKELEKIAQKEGIKPEEAVLFSDSVLYAVAREADGSMRDAQSLLEQLLAFSGDGLPDEEILDILGVIDRRSVLRAGEAVLSRNAEECLDLVEDIYRRGIDSRRFCRHLCDHFRNLLVLSAGDAREKKLDLPDEEIKLLREQTSRTTPDSLHLYFQMLLKGEEEIHRSSMPKIALEMLLLRMAQLPSLESLDVVLDRIAQLEATLRGECSNAPGGPSPKNVTPRAAVSTRVSRYSSAPPTPAPTPAPAPPAPPLQAEKSGAADLISGGGPQKKESYPGSRACCEEDNNPVEVEADLASPVNAKSRTVDPNQAVERWPGFVQFLENSYPMLWAILAHCGTRATGGMGIEIEVPDIYTSSTNSPDFLEKVDAATDAFFGSKFEWVIIKKETGQKGAPAKTPVSRQSGKQVLNHPAVQQAIEILGAELIEVKPSQAGPGSAKGDKKTGRS